MRLKSVILSSTSLAVFGLAAAPAAAQTAEPAPQSQDAASGTAADPAVTGAADGAAEGEEIVVTGFRQSLQTQQNIRRNSDQIVDSIVAEDIGKLPDIAVSDTAARIPGVQVERSGGEAGRVLVRGLPDFTTTYNGREIFTAETRVVALQDFPAGLIGAIEVFKTSSANLIDPGLAGLVNVRSRRPFDFGRGLEVAGSLWGLYTHQSDSITPNGNITVSNRWDTGGGGEIGALIGFSYTRLRYLDSTRSNTDFVAGGGPNGSRFPDIQRITYNRGDRTRPSVNWAVQWRPNPGLELYVEGLWQGFRNRVSDRETSVALWGGSGFTDAQYREGRPDLLESATVTNPRRPEGFQGGTYNKTDTYQVAVGGRWDVGPVRLNFDLARTDSTFTGSTASVDFAFADPQTVVFDTDIEGNDGGPTFSFVDFDPSDPDNYIYRGFYEEAQESSGDDWQARLDATWETEIANLPEIQFGVRYADRDAHREFGNRYHGAEDQRIPFSEVPLDYQLFQPGFRGNSLPAYRNWLSPTYRSIRRNLTELRQFSIDNGAGNFTLDAPSADPLQTFDANERNIAGYGQVRYEFNVGELTVDGNLGLRYASTKTNLVGTQLIFTDADGNGPGAPVGTLTPIDLNRSFSDWLPSINTRIRFNPQLQARLSFTETRTRPTFTELRPNFIPDNPPSCFNENPVPGNCFLFARGGNPQLEQLTSENYDAALEYYFSRTGFASISIFQRDLSNFIETSVQEATDISGLPIRVERPMNSGAGRIRGFEVQLSTFFDFVGLPQFGVQANVTHLDAEAEFTYNPGEDNERTYNRSLLGVSDWSANLIGIFESGGLSARLAYNWRSEFLTTFQVRGDHLYTEEADPVSRLDLSMSYDVTENFTVFGDWTNILGDPFTSSLTREDFNDAHTTSTFPRVVRYEETTLSAGVRFRF